MIVFFTKVIRFDSQVIEDLMTLVVIETKRNSNLITLFAAAIK